MIWKNYLHEVLHFHPAKTRQLGSLEEYAEALRRKETVASFLEVPGAKIFRANYSRVYSNQALLIKLEDLDFPTGISKGSTFLPGVNKALLELFETGKLRELENRSMLASEECVDIESDGETAVLAPTVSRTTAHNLVYLKRRHSLSWPKEN